MENTVTHSLARSVVLVKDDITAWYSDPANMAKFEAWLKERRTEDNANHS